jgi:hypothetical protein
MKTFKVCLVVALAVLTLGAIAYAGATAGTEPDVNIDDIKEIAVYNSHNPTVTVAAPATPGNLPADVTDADTYLHYTVNVASATDTRKITAALTTGDVPSAYTIALTPVVGSGGGGTEGTAANITELTSSEQDLVTGMVNCWTGVGATDGVNVTYTISCSAMPYYEADDRTSLAVTYTVAEE